MEFELKPGVRVIVYNTQLTLGKSRWLTLTNINPASDVYVPHFKKKSTAVTMFYVDRCLKFLSLGLHFQVKQHEGVWVGFDFKWNSLSRGDLLCLPSKAEHLFCFFYSQPQNERYTECNYVDYLVLENIHCTI